MKASLCGTFESQLRIMQATLVGFKNAADPHLDRMPCEVQRMLRYIHQHLFDRSLTVEKVKEECCLTNNNVSTRFRQSTGMGVRGYIINHRLKAARVVLRDMDISIYLLASVVGYTEEAFSRLFKKVYGCTPLEYPRGVLRNADERNGQEKTSREVVKSLVKKVNYLVFVVTTNAILSLCECAFAQGSWQVQNPLPTESYLLTVEPVTNNKIFAGGLGGTLLRTVDAGRTWDVQKFENLIDIRSITFRDSVNGWLAPVPSAGRYAIIDTKDGESTWEFLADDMNVYKAASIHFINEGLRWTVGLEITNTDAVGVILLYKKH